MDPRGRILEVRASNGVDERSRLSAAAGEDCDWIGRIYGVGLMQSKQKMLYLPEAQTDFIYGIVGEETGFLGSLVLLAGFVVVLWRGLRTYFRATDNFGRYLALSVTVCVVVQALINISVVLDWYRIKASRCHSSATEEVPCSARFC